MLYSSYSVENKCLSKLKSLFFCFIICISTDLRFCHGHHILYYISGNFHSMDTNNGTPISEEHLMSIRSCGSSNNSIVSCWILNTDWNDGKLAKLLQRLDNYTTTFSKKTISIIGHYIYFSALWISFIFIFQFTHERNRVSKWGIFVLLSHPRKKLLYESLQRRSLWADRKETALLRSIHSGLLTFEKNKTSPWAHKRTR